MSPRGVCFASLILFSAISAAAPPREISVEIENEFLRLPQVARENSRLWSAEKLHNKIRETVLAYDRLGLTVEELQARQACQRSVTLSRPQVSLDCLKLNSRQRRISDRLDYLNLVTFEDGVFGFKSRQRWYYEPEHELREFSYENTYMSVSETLNPEESLVSVIENHLLDPNFKYKRPATNYYLARLFGDNRANENLYTTMFMSDGQDVEIHPSRVYGVYLTYSEPTDSLIGHWGHLELIMVVCDPKRSRVDEECLKDTSRHISLGFRANEEYFKYKDGAVVKPLIDGITGRYDAQIMVNSFAKVKAAYAKIDRQITHYKLQLSDVQKNYLVYVLSEHAYLFRGYWGHLGNNCVRQLALLLNTVLNRADIQGQAYQLTTPWQLIESWSEKNLVEKTPTEF